MVENRDKSQSKHLFIHYVIVRSDLPTGFASAQLIHAAGESGRLVETLPPGTYAGSLAVRDEAALVELGRTLDAAGIPHVKIIEDSAPYAGQCMAIGIAPAPKEKLKRFLSFLPLYKGGKTL